MIKLNIASHLIRAGTYLDDFFVSKKLVFDQAFDQAFDLAVA